MSTDSPKAQSNNLAFKLVLFSFLAVLGIYVAYQLKALLICLIFAITLASAIAPVAEWGQVRKVPRIATVLSVYGVTLLVYALLAVMLIPTLKEEGSQLYENLPSYIEKAAIWIESTRASLGSPVDPSIESKDHSELDSKTSAGADTRSGFETKSDSQQNSGSDTRSNSVTRSGSDTSDTKSGSDKTKSNGTMEATSKAAKHLAANIPVRKEDIKPIFNKVFSQTLSMTAGVMGLGANVLLTLFLTAYFVIEAESLWPALLRWLPKNSRERWSNLISPLENRLGGFVRGQLLVSLCVGTFLFLGFCILGVKYALILGLMAGLLNLVPFVGSLLATGSAILVALNQDGGGPMLAVFVILLYGLEQWVESSFIVPHLLGKSVELHPLVVLFSILIGASLLGVAGALIAIPITSVVLLLSEEFYLKPMEDAEKSDIDQLKVRDVGEETPPNTN